MNQNLHQYLTNNHKKFTAREMAEELSLPLSKIQKTLSNMGLKALSPAERIKIFITDNPQAYVEDIAVLCEVSPNRIWILAKEAGIALKHRPKEKQEKYGAIAMKRFSDGYTQTGSPFGLADEVKGLKIK